MRKLFVSLFLAAVLIIAGMYAFTGSSRKVVNLLGLEIPYAQALRNLPDTSQWSRWWPWNEGAAPAGKISLAGYADTQVGLHWLDDGDTVLVLVRIIPAGNDSVSLAWEADLESGSKLLKRLRAAGKQARLEQDINSLLRAFGVYYSNPVTVYGMAPEVQKVKDTLLISARQSFDQYPDTRQIYQLIDRLQAFALQQDASVTGLPMYHIMHEGSAYQLMVALPVSKRLKEGGPFTMKRMVPGKLLVAEVQAGPAALPHLFQQFEQYKNDHSFVSPAIPFYQPVTNRLQEPDTTRWITRLCYPVF